MFRISDRQDQFVSSQVIYNTLLPKDHFLVLVDEKVDFTFINGMLEETYCPDNGRPTENYPSRMLKALFVQRYHNLTDRETRERANLELVVKWFLEYNVGDDVFEFTALSEFRNRVGEDGTKEAFFKINEQLQVAGLITPGESQTIDSTDVQSKTAILTVSQMIFRGIVKLLQEIRRISPLLEEEIKKQVGFEGDIAKKPVEYGMSDAEKQNRITRLVSMAVAAMNLAEISIQKYSNEEAKARVLHTSEVLRRIINEQTEEIEDKNGQTKRKKMKKEDKPKDRVASPVDPDARHGYKSSDKPFTGYKVAFTENENEIITDLCVEPGNFVDGDFQIPMTDELEEQQGKRPEKMTGDKAFGDGDVRRKQKGKGTTVVAPPKNKPGRKGKFSADAFHFYPETKEVTCPNGKTARMVGHNDKTKSTVYRFLPEDCGCCAMRGICTSASSRTVSISDYEEEFMEAEEYKKTDEYKKDMKRRSGHERKNNEMKNKHGMDRARYWGISNMNIQAFMTAIVVNIKRFFKLITTGNLPDGRQVCTAQ